MDYSFLKIEQHDLITVMKVSAPKSLNALNSTVLKEIDDFVSHLDTAQTRVLIITGDGEPWVIDNNAKNIMGILHAIQQLALQRSDFELNIVHDFENKEAEEYVKANNLSDIVHFLGRKTSAEISDLLHHAVCFLLFSNYENQPCVLLESFSTGTPVVTTPVGGILEITNDDNALIVPPKDEMQLIEKLNFILDHADQYQPAVIRKNALEICSPEVIGRKWLEIYRSL